MPITIDGKECSFKPGATILEVARENGIKIPTLCYHRKITPTGSCRVCVVEVKGQRKLQPACAMPAQDGMVVLTNTPQVMDARRVVVNLLLSSGEHNCLYCEQNGQCELQNIVYDLGIEKPAYIVDSPKVEIDNSSEMIVFDRRKCVLCGRCVEACNKVVVNEVLSMAGRGLKTRVVYDLDRAMADSTCVQCGECSQICPVGAIIDKRSRGKGRAWELEIVESVCPYCGVGCKLALHVDRRKNEIVRITGVEDGPANNGMLCIKGRYGFDFVASPERLTTPLIKEKGAFRKASWDEAIGLAVKRFGEIKDKKGADSLGGFASAKCTNEENFLFQKFIRTMIGTNNVDHCARL